MKGTCALYQIETDLQKSHIYPKFAVKYIKETGSNYLRRFSNPNQRMQDALKPHLLGKRAEQDFSKRENWFAQNIFRKFLESDENLCYDENLYYFAVSFLWRVLAYNLKRDSTIGERWYFDTIKKVEEEWRDFLTSNKFPRSFDKIYILTTDRVLSHDSDLEGVDFYMTRTFDSTIVDNEAQTTLMVYGKFSRFIFWSVIKEYGDENQIEKFKIDPIKGQLSRDNDLSYFPLSSFLYNRMKEIEELPKPSEAQQDKIVSEVKKDIEGFEKSDLGESIMNDFKLNKNK